jgi:hypothetical protein
MRKMEESFAETTWGFESSSWMGTGKLRWICVALLLLLSAAGMPSFSLSLSLSLVFSLMFSYNDFLGFSAAAPFIFASEWREVSIV